MPKDYWQLEDLGHIEETEGFPLPPVDAEGKPLEYVWVPSKSLRALSAACKRMSDALVGAEVKQERRHCCVCTILRLHRFPNTGATLRERGMPDIPISAQFPKTHDETLRLLFLRLPTCAPDLM